MGKINTIKMWLNPIPKLFINKAPRQIQYEAFIKMWALMLILDVVLFLQDCNAGGYFLSKYQTALGRFLSWRKTAFIALGTISLIL